VTAALDWIIGNAPEVDLVNMSLGTNARFAGDCDEATSWTEALGQAINMLKARGVSVFVSSGNSGSGLDMQAPACIANAISVGAVWDSDVGSRTLFGCTDDITAADQVACWSNSSTTTDLFAPGALVTSTRLGGESTAYAGTSQASPLVAACAALLLEESPNLRPARMEAMLKDSEVMVTDATNGLSFPRLDCAMALTAIFSDGFEGY
jgi:subtilisin family serine protease